VQRLDAPQARAHLHKRPLEGLERAEVRVVGEELAAQHRLDEGRLRVEDCERRRAAPPPDRTRPGQSSAPQLQAAGEKRARAGRRTLGHQQVAKVERGVAVKVAPQVFTKHRQRIDARAHGHAEAAVVLHLHEHQKVWTGQGS
jgi:hypothetical protein